MSQRYDVDDILEEIRRKKADQSGFENTSPRTYASGQESPPRTANRQGTRGAPAGMPDIAPLGTRTRGTQRPQNAAWGTQRQTESEGRKPAAPIAEPESILFEEAPQTERRERPRRTYTRQTPPSRRVRDDDYIGSGWGDDDPQPPRPQPASKRASSPLQRAPQEDSFLPEEDGAEAESLDETLDRMRRDRPQKKQEGFAFRAPGVAPVQEDSFGLPVFGEEAGAMGGGESDFSLHFDLDDASTEPQIDLPPIFETQETPFPGEDTQEIPSSRRKARRREDTQDLPANSRWQRSYDAQQALEEETPEDDFATPEDAPYVEKDLKSMRMGLFIRFGITAVLFALSLYFALALRPFPFAKLFGLEEPYYLMVPTFMISPEDPSKLNMLVYMISSLVVFIGAAITCSNVIGSGFLSLCKLHATSDSPAAIATLGVLVQGIVLVFFTETVEESDKISLYFPVAVAVLLFTLIGRLMLVNRVRRNFKLLTDDRSKYALMQIKERDFAREFSRGLGPDAECVAYSAPAEFFTGFLDRSYCGDYSDTFYRVAAPVSFCVGILVSVVTFLLSKSPAISVSVFAAVLCICAPLSSALVPNLMLGRLSKWLTKRGAMIAGYETAEEYAQTGAVVLSDKDLFSEKNVMLHGMKVFAEKRIDEAILDAASVIIGCRGIMSGVFLNMIGQNQRLLKKVDSPVYEDGMGISAWVDGKRVLIGSHELMRTHEIECPSKDFEARYVRDGRKVLYIANSGELSAMFVISYNADPKIADYLAELERRNIGIALYTTDPNITNELIAQNFGIKKKSVRILPAKMHPEYMYLMRPKERAAVGGAHPGGLGGLLMLLRASASIRRSVRVGALVQLLGSIVGYGLVVFMAFTDAMSAATCTMLLLFGLVCFVITSVAASVGRG